MKRLICLFLILAIVLAGCSSEEKPEEVISSVDVSDVTSFKCEIMIDGDVIIFDNAVAKELYDLVNEAVISKESEAIISSDLQRISLTFYSGNGEYFSADVADNFGYYVVLDNDMMCVSDTPLYSNFEAYKVKNDLYNTITSFIRDNTDS